MVLRYDSMSSDKAERASIHHPEYEAIVKYLAKSLSVDEESKLVVLEAAFQYGVFVHKFRDCPTKYL
jgi:hypothetical protein